MPAKYTNVVQYSPESNDLKLSPSYVSNSSSTLSEHKTTLGVNVNEENIENIKNSIQHIYPRGIAPNMGIAAVNPLANMSMPIDVQAAPNFVTSQHLGLLSDSQNQYQPVISVQPYSVDYQQLVANSSNEYVTLTGNAILSQQQSAQYYFPQYPIENMNNFPVFLF